MRFFLPWTWGVSSRLLQQSPASVPDLGPGVCPLDSAYDLGRVVSPLGHHSWPWTWDSLLSWSLLQWALIRGPDIPRIYTVLLMRALDLTSITSYIHNWLLFLLSLKQDHVSYSFKPSNYVTQPSQQYIEDQWKECGTWVCLKNPTSSMNRLLLFSQSELTHLFNDDNETHLWR